MASNKEILEKYKDYTPQTVEYEEDVDGGTIPVRDKMLDEKEKARLKFEARMKAMSSGRTAR